MTRERLKKVRMSLSFQNSEKHTIYQHWSRVFQQCATLASQDLQRNGTAPFFLLRLQNAVRTVVNINHKGAHLPMPKKHLAPYQETSQIYVM
jgi:hypothetical protein